MGVFQVNSNDHETARNLWPHQIEACDCAETLTGWYLSCRNFSDDLIAQIEADKISQMKDAGWLRLVNNYLVGCRKSIRQIERRADELGFSLPEGRSSFLNKRVDQLERQNSETRIHERETIIEYLLATHGARGAEIAEEIREKQHHVWRRQVATNEATNEGDEK
jgi:hypothetical protein